MALRGRNEIITALREIVEESERGSRCRDCNQPHEIIERNNKSSRIGFGVTSHKPDCVVGQLRKLCEIPDEEFA
jgi:hypothetical protein